MNGKKVYVGLSGGVDSSVAATLLKQSGYDVTGVYIKIWHPDFLNCNFKDEMRDAMRICAKLDIPFKTIDLSKDYEKDVIEYMLSEYKKGNTPNPDVMCNKYIKFGRFFDYAINSGADYVATGHYAKTENGKLLKAKDENKDQTYFLWTLKEKQLKQTLFPIGDLIKDDVRKIAKKNNLFTYKKKDSQGLCFVGHVDMKEFLKNHIKTERGSVLNVKGEVIGEHDGATLYTIGERHGFVITKKGVNDPIYYVISKNIEDNTITVSSETKGGEIGFKEITLSNISFVNEPTEGEVEVRFRYRQKLQKANISKNILTFQKEQEGVAKGQSVVIYKGNQCLGGAIIS